MGDVQTTYTAICGNCGAIHCEVRPDTTTAGVTYPESFNAQCHCTDPATDIVMEKTATDGHIADAIRAARALQGR